MKRPARITLIVLAALFLLLFLARFAWELARPPSIPFPAPAYVQNEMVQSADSLAIGRSVKNFASSKIVIKQAAADQVVDQKYERVAALESHSADFDGDRAKAAALSQELSAVVQAEDFSGLAGARRLALTLGVVPDRFEGLVERLKAIGSLDSISVNKTDKTADFKALAAKRLSLEKTRDGLRALKVPGAALADLINLETRILEIEGQIQELGVSLGDYDETNSFCTVRFTLSENPAAKGPDILGALLAALEWTVPLYLALVCAAALVLGAAVLAGLLVDRIRQWQAEARARKPPQA
jgi:hypothetical protein